MKVKTSKILKLLKQYFQSLGEVWLGLDYWFWVQRSFGKTGAKLCNYIASGDTQRTYEYVCYEKFLITGAKDSFRIAKIGQPGAQIYSGGKMSRLLVVRRRCLVRF